MTPSTWSWNELSAFVEEWGGTPKIPGLILSRVQDFLYLTWNLLPHYCETGKTLPSQLDVESLVG